jgi:hypothetical protein
MARRNPQTLGKRQREQAKREKRERKQQKKAAAAAAKTEGQLIALETYGTRDEAEVVQGLLATAGIEAMIKVDDAGGAFPMGLSGGGAQVLVDESVVTAASELLAADET